MADGENSEEQQGGKIVFRETREDRLEFEKRMAKWREHMRQQEDKMKAPVTSSSNASNNESAA